MKLDKQELVRMLRTEGDNDTADKVVVAAQDTEPAGVNVPPASLERLA